MKATAVPEVEDEVTEKADVVLFDVRPDGKLAGLLELA